MLPAVANADSTFTSLSAWQTAVGTWTETQILSGGGVPDGTNVTSVTLDDGTLLSLSATQTVTSIGVGWATWSGGYTGQVIENLSATPVSASITPTVGGLGMFIEPNQFTSFGVTLLLSSGATIFQQVNGSGGALFFGYTGSDVTNVTISSADGSGFAYGDFFTTPVTASVQAPEPGSIMLLGTGLLALGGTFRRKKT